MIWFCIISLIQLSQGKIVSGVIDSDSNWVFVARFCFLGSADSSKPGHVGRLSWSVTYNMSRDGEKSSTPHYLLLYPDDDWETVYPGDSLNCTQKKDVLSGTGNSHWISPVKAFSGCKEIDIDGVPHYKCEAGKTFGTPTEKWWYIVIENCASTQGIKVEYEMTMTNSLNDEDIFFQHYSADEFFILQTDIGFLVIYFLMAGLSLYVTYSLVTLQLFHITYKMYLASLALQIISLIVQVAYWSNYGLTGIPKDFWKYLGRFLEFVSVIVFVVLLILMAKGYTITRGRIRKIGVIKIIVFSVIYCLITVAMFIWEATTFDAGKVLFIYQSVPGYCLIAVRILAWLWFCYATFFTVKNYPEKKMFYLPFFVIFCVWFWAGPIVTFIAFNGIPKWTREKTVNGVNLFVIFFGHLVFMILTWPSQANENFPYHVKTTQITDASLGDPSKGVAYDADISNHGRRDSQNIFTTSNGTNQPVNVDRFPHETGDYIQERAVAMDRMTR